MTSRLCRSAECAETRGPGTKPHDMFAVRAEPILLLAALLRIAFWFRSPETVKPSPHLVIVTPRIAGFGMGDRGYPSE